MEEALEGFPGLFKSNKDEPLVDALMRDVKRINQNVNFGQPDVKENFTTEHIADVSKKIKRAADSANKNLDNALEIAVDALKRIADAPIGYNLYAEEALEKISKILKITKGGKDE